MILSKITCLAALVLSSLTAQAQSINPIPVINDSWRFSGTISAWAPASWTTSSVGNLSKSADSSISDNLNSAGGFAYLTAEAHKGSWGLMADLVYWQLTGSDSVSKSKVVFGKDHNFYEGTNAQQTQTSLTVAGTYTGYRSNNLYVDGLAGVRYISSTTTVQANTEYTVGSKVKLDKTINPSYTNQTTDPVIGFKGRARLYDSSWFIPFYADAGKGPGSNNTTWQALIGVGDAFSWGDITLAYRAMGYDMKSNRGVTNYTNAGPQLSATINF
jgi:hypothetical protein